MKKHNPYSIFGLLLLAALVPASCKKSGGSPGNGGSTDTTVTPVSFDINSIHDTYDDVAAYSMYPKWGSYNVHDPSIKKFGDTYYCYSTDVGYGVTVPAGIQVRTSKDLVQWQYAGWVFNGLPALGAQFITSSGGTPFQALWAPYVLKVSNEYRLYYSLSSAVALPASPPAMAMPAANGPIPRPCYPLPGAAAPPKKFLSRKAGIGKIKKIPLFFQASPIPAQPSGARRNNSHQTNVTLSLSKGVLKNTK